MTRLIIENASYVVTVDATDTVLRDTTITIDDGVITAVSPAAPNEATQPEAVVRPQAGTGRNSRRQPAHSAWARCGWSAAAQASGGVAEVTTIDARGRLDDAGSGQQLHHLLDDLPCVAPGRDSSTSTASWPELWAWTRVPSWTPRTPSRN